jgi:hypothetical protein
MKGFVHALPSLGGALKKYGSFKAKPQLSADDS